MRYGREADILHVEGQGSLLHPGSTAILPLIRGCQPTHFILVHRAGQTHNHTFPNFEIPPLPDVIHMYEALAGGGGIFTQSKVAAIALNTHHLDAVEAQQAVGEMRKLTNLPCADPVRDGAEILLDAVLDRAS